MLDYSGQSNSKREATMGFNDYLRYFRWLGEIFFERDGWRDRSAEIKLCYEENDCLVRNWKVASVSKI